MNLQQLYYFQKIASLENYSKAAEELHISQSNLSHAMSELEKELTVALFYKKGRNIHLSKYGIEFLKYVDRALNEVETGKSAMLNFSQSYQGRITLSFVSSLATNFIPKIIAGFKKDHKYDGVDFALREEKTALAVKSVEEQLADFGFGTNTGNPNFAYYPVYEEKLVAVVPKKHSWAGKEAINVKELNDVDFIAYDNYCGTKIFVDKLLSNAKVIPHTVYEVPNDTMIASMTACNLGVGIMPDSYEIKHFGLKAIPISGVDSTMRMVYMFMLKNSKPLPLINKFKKFVLSFTRVEK
jgi:DNA-binding transcriptional LysR family regulator